MELLPLEHRRRGPNWHNFTGRFTGRTHGGNLDLAARERSGRRLEQPIADSTHDAGDARKSVYAINGSRVE